LLTREDVTRLPMGVQQYLLRASFGGFLKQSPSPERLIWPSTSAR
jgi:hypothetical protein